MRDPGNYAKNKNGGMNVRQFSVMINTPVMTKNYSILSKNCLKYLYLKHSVLF